MRVRALSWLFLGLMVGGAVLSPLAGQELLRSSLAGESSAEGDHAGTGSQQPYNLLVGPISLRMDGGVSASYNDNINLARTGRLSDFIVTPDLNVHAFWQVTDLNSVNLDVGLSYQRYISHDRYSTDNVLLAPESAAQFNLYIGDFKINVHDRFSYQEDPTQVGQLSNTAQFRRFINTAGVQVDWDADEMILTLNYDHSNVWVFDSQYDYLNNNSDTITPKVTFLVTKTITVGAEAAFTQTTFDQNVQNNSDGVEVGPFLNALLTDKLAFTVQAGWNLTHFDQGGQNGDNSSISSYYYSLGINHRINNFLSESLTAGREFEPGLTTNFTRRYFVDYTPSWQIMPSLRLAPDFWWENLDDSDGSYREQANRYGAGLHFGYAITQHATASVGYQYILKTANPSVLNYSQDVTTVGMDYQF